MSVNLTTEQKTEVSNYINAYRAIHQSGPLSYDDTISEYSNSWAAYLADNNVFYNSGSKTYGENIAYLQGTELIQVIKKAIDGWYNEISSHDFSVGEFSPDTAKLTCLLWKESTQYGIGISINNKSVIIVLNTNPLGNIINKISQNVLAPILNLRIQTPQAIPQPAIIATPVKTREQPIPLREQEQPKAQPKEQVQVQSKGPSKKDILDGLYQVGNALYSNKDKVNVALVLNKIINALSLGMPEGTTKSELLKSLYSLNFTISTAKDMGSCFGTLSIIINQLKEAPPF